MFIKFLFDPIDSNGFANLRKFLSLRPITKELTKNQKIKILEKEKREKEEGSRTKSRAIFGRFALLECL